MMLKEWKEAIAELKAAQAMFDCAANKWRIDEATYRVKAAESRLRAILYEGGEKGVEKNVGAESRDIK
jgi:hypothetical protein